MSTYRVEVLPAALRSIRKLPSEAKRRIQAAIDLLADEARPPAAKKFTGRPEWRVRMGDYRILYRIQDEVLLVAVVDAGHGRDTYRE
ncbi:type II toxin-antitoxin system RelE family toxin [Sinomonas flava]|uniref:type II toxin-antitoxin system RelE family toxin n=1 Tax=Sinomonas flava TaxID=496857 RepID=UPI0039A6915E